MVAVAIGALLAFVNGANDLSKGIATLVGSGLATPKRALGWGTLWTLLGAVAGAIFATAMVATFGKGLLAPHVAPTHVAAISSIVGAAAWVLLATGAGLPVSTTHAIVGAIVGVAVFAYGPQGVRWSAIGGKIVVPLLASPLAAAAITLVVQRAMRALLLLLLPLRTTAGHDCMCVDVETIDAAGEAAAVVAPRVVVTSCADGRPAGFRITLDGVHWATSAATCFARAMNDAPKIVALVLAASVLGATDAPASVTPFLVVAVAMSAGGLVAGRRVTRVMGQRLARIAPRDGFAANAVTALLVAGGAMGGLPMSTTHVASGGIVGAALATDRSAVHAHTARNIALAWLVTVPAAAALGVGAYVVGTHVP